jgi:AraC-like DNA-binding protein
MARIEHNFTWSERTGGMPALRSASESYGKHVNLIARYHCRLWVLDYAFARHGSVRVGSTRRPWRARPARTAHLYPPNTSYWEDTSKEKAPRHSGFLLFAGGEHTALADRVDAFRGHARFLDPEGVLGRLIESAARSGAASGEAGFWEAQAALCRALHLLVNAERVDAGTYRVGSATMSAESDFVRQVNRLLGLDLAAPLSLARLTAEMHVSVSALSHRYRRETGMPPMATRRALRIERAKALLLRGLPLKVIAEELGFSDAFHLSKKFKQVVGLAPRHFLCDQQRCSPDRGLP